MVSSFQKQPILLASLAVLKRLQWWEFRGIWQICKRGTRKSFVTYLTVYRLVIKELMRFLRTDFNTSEYNKVVCKKTKTFLQQLINMTCLLASQEMKFFQVIMNVICLITEVTVGQSNFPCYKFIILSWVITQSRWCFQRCIIGHSKLWLKLSMKLY